MLDPRMYRTGLVVVAVAALVLAFSLQNQPSALSSSLAPDAFNGQNAYSTMTSMAKDYPIRSPGSAGDEDVAKQVQDSLNRYGFPATMTTFSARTADGAQPIEDVVGIRPGMASGSLVVLTHRDARGSPSAASLSGTATLIELARDLQGETLNHTVVLASTSGSQGTAGAIHLAQTLDGPIDAVLVLGDLASKQVHQPVVVPWSNSPLVAPLLLRTTVSSELNQQAAIPSTGTSVFGQFVHLAAPLTLTEQAPFVAHGVPAVLLSLSGERGPAPDAALGGVGQINAVGRAVLSTVSALDAGPTVPAPSAYVLFDKKVVPGWAMSVFILSLVVPVLLTTIDALARARRRHYRVWRWLVAVLAAAVPFVVGVLVILAARVLGGFGVAPPGLVPAGTVPLHTGGMAILIIAALLALASFLVLRPVVIRFAAGPRRSRDAEGALGGATVALLAMMCLVTVAIWLVNPFAAALVIPALHLWLLALILDIRMPAVLRAGLVLAGLLPVACVIVYYGVTLGFGPLEAIWGATLLIAGHAVSLSSLLVWCLFLGCVVSAGGIVVALARQPRPEQQPVTVRGPVTYAGPGSLGGTKSAMRR